MPSASGAISNNVIATKNRRISFNHGIISSTSPVIIESTPPSSSPQPGHQVSSEAALIGMKILYSKYSREIESRSLEDVNFREMIASNADLEAEIFKSIDVIYFNPVINNNGLINGMTHGVSGQDMVINNLPVKLDLGYIFGEKKRLEKQLMVIEKRLNEMIIKILPSLMDEYQSIEDIQTKLSNLVELIKTSRSHLKDSAQDVTSHNLSVVNLHQRQKSMKILLDSLFRVKSLQEDYEQKLLMSTHETLNQHRDSISSNHVQSPITKSSSATQLFSPSPSTASSSKSKLNNSRFATSIKKAVKQTTESSSKLTSILRKSASSSLMSPEKNINPVSIIPNKPSEDSNSGLTNNHSIGTS